MNDIDRLDRWLPARLTDLVGSNTPDYLDDVLGTVARTRQRPAWSFPGRWLPMAEFVGRPSVALSVTWRPIVAMLVVVCLLVATAAVFIGSRPRVPAPLGPAANGRIAYTVDGDIWTAEPDGSDARLIVGGSGEDSSPTYSPDGTKIGFARQDGEDHVRIVVANADGSDPHEVTTEPLLFWSGLAWAPDSRSVAIAANIGGRPSVAIAQADGSGMTTLDLDMAVDSPAWRPPDGRELVVRGHPVTGVDLFIVDADGRDPRPLGLERSGVFYSNDDLLGPAWSPDGARIAYHTPEAAPPGSDTLSGADHAFRVHVVNADGSGDRVISASPPDVDETWPVWSPDGASLIVERNRGDENWLGILPADGSGAGIDAGPVVTTGPGIAAAWSPDGSSVLAYYLGAQRAEIVDPLTGDHAAAGWSSTSIPGWQRLMP